MKSELKTMVKDMINPVIGLIIIVSIILGIEKNYSYFIISVIGVMALFIIQDNRKKRFIKMRKAEIKNLWGKEHKDKRNFIDIKKLHNYFKNIENSYFSIDDITWRDLNMNSVFEKIDHTKSLAGMQYLYYILRKPLFKKEILKDRNKTINLLMNNIEVSQSIQYHLSTLLREEGRGIFEYFKNGITIDTKPLIFYRILSYMPYIVIVGFLIKPPFAFLILIGVISLNTILYQSNKKKVYLEMDTFKYLGSLLKTSEEVLKVKSNNIDLEQEELDILLKNMKTIRKSINKINFNDNLNSDMEILIHYYNMITLKEPKVFYKTINLMNKYRENLFRVYTIIGKIDAYVSIASYKSSLDYYTEPDFNEEGSRFYLKTEDLYHPLLNDPVPYSIELNNKGALVTGSNASGKSTFLRTIGVNSIFAQTLNLALAKDYKSSYFKLLTSIGTTDNIVEGDSYFMAEAKSLKRVLDSLDPNQPVLCILDEIFRGTNTAERISAALESLNYMIYKNASVIAATHDIELTNLVNDKYNNYHFREAIETNDIKFDYILRHGPCTTRNAIAILKYLGYPSEIYENATKSAEKYLENEII